tara:strand:- start:5690 stop:7285 length:1596 start_codon:yes stop_codon:yes gene_type:complete
MTTITAKNQLENGITQLSGLFNTDKFNSSVGILVNQKLITSTTKLGTTPGQVVNGFQSLSPAIDDVVSSVPGSVPSQLTGSLVIAHLTNVPPLVGDQLVRTASTAADLKTITGNNTASTPKLLNVAVAAATPAAIAATMKNISVTTPQILNSFAEQMLDLSIPINQALSDIGHVIDVVLGKAVDLLKSAIGAVTGLIQNLASLAVSIVSDIAKETLKIINKIASGFGSLIENIVEKIFAPAANTIFEVARIGGIIQVVTQKDLKSIITLVAIGEFNSAAKALQKFSDRPINVLEDKLKSIDASGSTAIKPKSTGAQSTAIDIKTLQNEWNGGNTPNKAFTYIDTKEELQADILSSSRSLTEVVIHHTFTGTNQNLTSGDINTYSSETFGYGIPYHYIITRDGRIQRGRPINIESESLKNNHQKHSIQLAMVGGMNVPIGTAATEDYQKYLSKSSFHTKQWTGLQTFLRAVYAAYPGIQVVGHSEIDDEQLDPGFVVADYIFSKYGKKSVYTDPQNQPSPTRTELLNRAGPQ